MNCLPIINNAKCRIPCYVPSVHFSLCTSFILYYTSVRSRIRSFSYSIERKNILHESFIFTSLDYCILDPM